MTKLMNFALQVAQGSCYDKSLKLPDKANYNVYQEYHNTYIINWVNVYIVLHDLEPSRADCFKHASNPDSNMKS